MFEVDQRITSKLAVDPDSGCWLWTAARDRHGYGLVSKLAPERAAGGSNHWMAHRYVYEAVRGPIPAGLVLDHLCRNTSCVNPDHLEPVTLTENFRRGAGPGAALWDGTIPVKAKSLLDHCAHGHAYTAGNTYTTPKGWRKCRACTNAAQRRYNARKR